MDFNTFMSNTALVVLVVASVKLWFAALAHYKYVMVKLVAENKKLAKNQLTIEQIINKAKEEFATEKENENE